MEQKKLLKKRQEPYSNWGGRGGVLTLVVGKMQKEKKKVETNSKSNLTFLVIGLYCTFPFKAINITYPTESKLENGKVVIYIKWKTFRELRTFIYCLISE